LSDPSEALARCRVLADLTREQLGALVPLVEVRDLSAGSSLFREGDEADEVLLIAEGSVRLERGRVAFGVVGSGEVLGGVSLASVGRRGCDAIAEEGARVLALTRSAYMQLRADHPFVALALHEGLLRELASHVRALAESQPARA